MSITAEQGTFLILISISELDNDDSYIWLSAYITLSCELARRSTSTVMVMAAH